MNTSADIIIDRIRNARYSITGIKFSLVGLENSILAIALSLIMVLPITEIFLRFFFNIGIDNVNGLILHLTLVIGTLGAAIAAREGKLLAFAGAKLFKSGFSNISRLLTTTMSLAVCGVLVFGSISFIQFEKSGGVELAYGIPVWVVTLVFPITFCLIAMRLLKRSQEGTLSIIGVILFALAVIGFILYTPLSTPLLRTIVITALVITALFGQPVFAVVGGTALILIWTEGIPIASVTLDHYSLTSNTSLPAIPLFTLTGYLLAESRAPQRLVALFDALFGRINGGPAIATVLACTFFTCFTGASGVTILALGGLVMPLMLNAGYSRQSSLGLLTGGGSAGVLLLPALPLILYAIVGNIPIMDMFLGGILPAFLMLILAVIWGISQKPAAVTADSEIFDIHLVRCSLWEAKWELLIPVVLLSGMFSGLMTPLEAAAITALYTLVVEVYIHRDLSLGTDVVNALVKCGSLIGGILLILGLALGLTNYMVDAQIPIKAVEWVKQTIESPWVFLLALNGCLLIVGFFIDIFSAIVVLTPLIIPMGMAFGIHPVHLGIIFLANLELGYLTPPVGMNLFFSSARFERPLLEVCRSVIPLFFMLAAGVLLITYIPWLSTMLPDLLG